MIGAVIQCDLDVHDGIACQNTGLHRALDTGVDRGNVFLRDGAADNGIDELIALAGLVRLELDLDVTVLALTAGLTGILHIDVCLALHGLLVSDLRCADIGLHLELAQQTVNDDLQMQFAHAGDDCLPRLLIGLNPLGTVLASFFIQHITAGGAYVDKTMYCAQISDLISAIIIYLCGFVLFMKYAMNASIAKREEKAIQRAKAAEADGKGGDQ